MRSCSEFGFHRRRAEFGTCSLERGKRIKSTRIEFCDPESLQYTLISGHTDNVQDCKFLAQGPPAVVEQTLIPDVGTVCVQTELFTE